MKNILSFIVSALKRFIFLQMGWTWCNKAIKIKGKKEKVDSSTYKAYRQKWSILSSIVLKKYLQVFKTDYNDERLVLNIAPEDIVHNYIEPILNPYPYRYFVEDKNNFGRLLPKSFLPKEFLHCIQGILYDENYKRIPITQYEAELKKISEKCSNIIVKPSVNSCSGNGIVFYSWNDKDFIDSKGITFVNRLKRMDDRSNFVVQECFVQSDFMSQFCKTSVNTLRIVSYKSVHDDKIHIPAMIMRMGKDGSMVDNAHAGGCFIGISPIDGTLGKYVSDQWGVTNKIFNGIDFLNKEFKIPNFDEIIEFTQTVHDFVPYHRLLALDVVIDKFGHPKLLEYNISGFSCWLFPFIGQVPFGKWTDEIIEYCSKRKKFQRIWMV